MDMNFEMMIIPLVMGLLELAKISFKLNTRFAPVVALVLSVGLSVLIMKQPLTDEIVMGIMYGLSACGLYSGTKAVIKK